MNGKAVDFDVCKTCARSAHSLYFMPNHSFSMIVSKYNFQHFEERKKMEIKL